jgi:feruloyl-CoA synthase
MSRPRVDATVPAIRPEKRWRTADLGPLDVLIEKGSNGDIYTRSLFSLGPYEAHVTRWLDRWAEQTPDRMFLAERSCRSSPDDWTTLTYAQARQRARALAQALLPRGLSAERPLVILSGNSIAHALLGLGALYAGIPYAPLSPAVSLVSRDFARLRSLVDLLTPGLVFAEDGMLYADALAALPNEMPCLVGAPGPSTNNIEFFDDWLSMQETAALERAHAAAGPDTIAKFMFTSGSTATPKAVVTTHKMLCANQAMIAHSLCFLAHEPPVVLDWLPWSHSFGGNQNFNLVLAHGGTLYIDDGRPTPDGIDKTVANLRDISPTLHFNVPAGLEALLPHLARRRKLATRFFRHLRLTFFAGAPIARATYDAWNEIALSASGENILTMSGYGATESGPATTFWTPFIDSDIGVGLPLPGCALKLVPKGEKLEARVKGAHVTPGYWRDPQATEEAFDDEGFFRLGDALRLADERRPHKGFCFDGRTNEDFKLASGTWVSTGPLRDAILAAFAPYAADVVIAGDGAPFAAALIFLDIEACGSLSGTGAPAAIVSHPAVRAEFQSLLDDFAGGRAPSRRIARLLLLAEPPAANEKTDKGGLNRAVVLTHRPAAVASLFSATPPAQVIVASVPEAADALNPNPL